MTGAADDGEVVGARRVVPRPDEERQGHGGAERCQRGDAWTPALPRQEQRRGEQDEDQADGADQDEQCEPKADRRSPSRCARLDESSREQRHERERGGVQRIAREPVEEQHVAGIGENERRHDDPRSDADRPSDAPPAEHGERVQPGHGDLGGERAEREEALCDDARHRSAHE